MLLVDTCEQGNVVAAIGGGRDGSVNWLLDTGTMSKRGCRMSEIAALRKFACSL